MHPNHAVDRRLVLRSAALLAAYFIYFNWDRVTMHFAADEMMNISLYFRPGPWRLALWQLSIWKNVPRPLGGVFYLPLYYLFGLNPAPYQIVITVILAANGYWLYRFARILGCAPLVAGVATLIGIYHPGLTNLHYNTDMIYDVLCFFFFFAALVYWARIRRDDGKPGRREIAVLLVLYLAALDSKEMAVTLPIVLAAYEWFFHGARGFRASWRAVLPMVAMNAAYVVGKFFGPDPLIKAGGYGMAFSVARALEFQRRSVGEIVCWRNDLTLLPVAAIWLLVTLIAWRSRAPALRFCWCMMVVTPVPIEFLAGRGQGCLYIPMAAWVVFASIVLVGALRAIAEFLVRLLRSADGVLALLLAGAAVLWCGQVQHWKDAAINPAAAQQGVLTREMIRQFQEMHVNIRPGGRIVFLHNPFEGWDLAFIAELVLKDRKLDIHLQDHNPLPDAEIATADAVFDYRDGKLVRVR
jgi:hypothetical protein